MLKLAGATIDSYDDGCETLRQVFPSLDQVPEAIKTASFKPREALANEDFALVAVDEGRVFRKYACYDAGNTMMSVVYFMEHGHKLPEEAVKVAAANLTRACLKFDLVPPAVMVKQARIFGAEEPSDMLLEESVPYEHRRRALERYLQQKSQEEPTSYLRSMGTGGLIGGGLGGLAGGISHGPVGAGIGALIGGLGGAGAGGLMGMADRAEIERAGHELGDVDQAALARASAERQARANSESLTDERRHREHMGALGGKTAAANTAGIGKIASQPIVGLRGIRQIEGPAIRKSLAGGMSRSDMARHIANDQHDTVMLLGGSPEQAQQAFRHVHKMMLSSPDDRLQQEMKRVLGNYDYDQNKTAGTGEIASDPRVRALLQQHEARESPEEAVEVAAAGDQPLPADLAQLIQMHERRETPEEEAMEQQTGQEAHPDDIVGPGPAGFLPGAQINPELLGAVDVTGQAPMPKVASARPAGDEDYAVVMPDGRRLYPVGDWDNLKVASDYWLENERQMAPEIRRQFAVKLASRSEELQYHLPEEVRRAGATTWADYEHVKTAMVLRQSYVSEDHQPYYDDLLDVAVELGPEKFAQALHRLDLETGASRVWNHVMDPYQATYDLQKEADELAWEDGADRVTHSALRNLATNHAGGLERMFGWSLLRDFAADPSGTFEGLPTPMKRIVARLADDIASSGRSDGQTYATQTAGAEKKDADSGTDDTVKSAAALVAAGLPRDQILGVARILQLSGR